MVGRGELETGNRRGDRVMIERVTDYRRVKKITDANPISSDNPWQILALDDVFYLVEVEDGEDLGVWCLEPETGMRSHGRYLMHSAMGPRCKGKRAVESGLDAIGWLFEHTDADVVVAPVPAELRHARLIPLTAGLSPIGEHNGSKLYMMDREMHANQVRMRSNG